MEPLSEERLKEVHPELGRRIRQLDEQLQTEGIILRVVQGLRTWAQQDALYSQGRDVPGQVVTQAKGGDSAHNFGYAVDVAPNDPDFPTWHPDWNVRSERWNIVLAKAIGCGLAEGAEWRTFPDVPHLYLQELPATPDDAMRINFREGGLEAVWKDWERTYSIAGGEAG